MASWAKFISNSIAALAEINGEGTIATSGILKGRRLPRTSAIDALTLLAQTSPALVGAVMRISMGGKAWPVGVADAEGIYDPSNLANVIATGLDAKAYVAGYPSPNAPYQRSRTAITAAGVTLINTSQLFEPVLEYRALGGEETALLGALREEMHAWQRAVNAATSLALAAPSLDYLHTGDLVDVFWGALTTLGNGLEVIAEAPISDRFDVLKGALKASTSQTATFVATQAGELAAAGAEIAGNTAGTFADAFFKNAGFVSLLVAGVAVYIVLG